MDRKIILALILSFGIIFAWQKWVVEPKAKVWREHREMVARHDATPPPPVSPTAAAVTPPPAFSTTASLPVNYRVISSESHNIKALSGRLSETSRQEILAAPMKYRKVTKIHVPEGTSRDQLKATLIDALGKEIHTNADLDEVIVFAYGDDEEMFSLKLTWAPGGEWGSTTPEIAASNDRSSYRVVFEDPPYKNRKLTSKDGTAREREIFEAITKALKEGHPEYKGGTFDAYPVYASAAEDWELKKFRSVAKRYGITEDALFAIVEKLALAQIEFPARE